MAAADTSRKVVCRQLEGRDSHASAAGAAPKLHQPCRPHPHQQRSLIPKNGPTYKSLLVGVQICWREFAFVHFPEDFWLIFFCNPPVYPEIKLTDFRN